MEENILKKLLLLSDKAYKKNEVPISAIVISDGRIISKAYNKRNKTNKTIAHAEILAINKANKKLKTWRLNNCSLYTTVKPCDMCMNVIKESRIDKVYYLLDRLEEKKQYDKTKFIHLSNPEIEIYNKKYLEKVKKFWKKKRNKV